MSASLGLVEVLGTGCARCQETFRVVMAAVQAAGLPFSVVKNESLARMVELGVLATPALAVNGKVVLAGRVPTPEEVVRLLGGGLK
ncbi:MAG: thioredoxin family protein [Thermoanaerobaculum sp.]|nr:thioredoxin family protein [Thermoanaerobaculum sp.]